MPHNLSITEPSGAEAYQPVNVAATQPANVNITLTVVCAPSIITDGITIGASYSGVRNTPKVVLVLNRTSVQVSDPICPCGVIAASVTRSGESNGEVDDVDLDLPAPVGADPSMDEEEYRQRL